MEHWFLHYYGKERAFFSGNEDFTLFDLVSEGLQRGILAQTGLAESEKPVFLLKCDNATFILNTTHRFIRIGGSGIESVLYSEFAQHSGYKSIRLLSKETTAAAKGIKTDGYFEEFGLRLRSGEVLYWSIPSGKPGFAFWNVTKKCELIGRKYQP